MALKVTTNTDNFLFVETGANVGIKNFNYTLKENNFSYIHLILLKYQNNYFIN